MTSVALTRRGSAALWFAVFGGPTAWFTGLVAAYFLVPWACATGSEAAIHLVSLVTTAAGAAAVATGAVLWRRGPAGAPRDRWGRQHRTRFLVATGTLLGLLFTLGMTAQWLGAVVHGPCEPLPRLPESPWGQAPDSRYDPSGPAFSPSPYPVLAACPAAGACGRTTSPTAR